METAYAASQPLRSSLQVAPLSIHKNSISLQEEYQQQRQDQSQHQPRPHHNYQLQTASTQSPHYSSGDHHSISPSSSGQYQLQRGSSNYAYKSSAPASSSDMYSQSQITPPATPRTGVDGFESRTNHIHHQQIIEEEEESQYHNQQEDYEETHVLQPPVFHNFLRAIFPFTPTTSSGEASVTLPLNEGDVILVHSIHTNGWADGALLASGARGWLPTNYCEAYNPEYMRGLLAALLSFWDLLRSTSVKNEEIFGNQEFMKGIIAGVRYLLERTDCLTRESPTIQRNDYMRRGRKSLLAELSTLVKIAKQLPDCQRGILPPGITDVSDIVDQMILKAFKIVIKGVRFLDLHEEDRRHRLPPSIDPPAVPVVAETSSASSVSSASSRSQTQPQEQPSHSMASSSIPPTPPADDTSSFDPPPAPLTVVTLPNKRLSNAYSPGATAFGRNKPVNNNRLSFAGSTRVQRWSLGISHRMSVAGPASPLPAQQHLVSQRLSKSHDTFLSHLGSFIGRLQFQSQSHTELVLSIKQSATSGGGLLAVVDVVCFQTTVSADIITAARASMFERIQELVSAGHEIIKKSSPEDTDAVMPQENGVLIAAATGCVKAAGDCVAKTKWVVERIGDFEFELDESWSLGIDLSVLDFSNDTAATATPSEPATQIVEDDSEKFASSTDTVSEERDARQSQTSVSNSMSSDVRQSGSNESQKPQHTTKPSIAASLDKPLPEVPQVEVTTPGTTESFDNIETARHSTTSSISHSRPASAQGSDVASPRQDNVRELTSPELPASPKPSRLSLPPLPQISTTIDKVSSESHPDDVTSAATTDFQPSPTFETPATSSADSGTTHTSRDSESSMLSRTSTRATTPDGPRNKSSISGLSTNSSSKAESVVASHDADVEDDENKLLVKTYAHELMFNKEGQVTGGTIPALVERLTTHESTPDAMFVSTFYLTFRLFCSPVRFAQALVDRFDYVAGAPHMSGPVRLRVYNAFKGWMESHWRDQTDRDALSIIVPFADTKLSAVLPSAGRRLVELAQRVSHEGALVPRLVSSMGKTNTAIAAYISPDTPLPQVQISRSTINALNNWKNGGPSPSILDFDPLEFARQLTVKQMNIFSSIMPTELLGSQWMKKAGVDAPNVKAMSTLSTDLSNFVAENILGYTEVKKRAAAIKQWIKISYQLYELHNYDGLMAIICRLNSSTITRLRKTWDNISPKRREMLKNLQAIVEPQHNHKALRSKLHDHVPPCLPFLGMYLTDLTFVDIGNQATKQLHSNSATQEASTSMPSSPRLGGSDNNGSATNSKSNSGITVVNFDKHTRTAKIIGELQRFQIPYRLTEVPDIQDWISANLERVHGNDQGNVQVTYYRQSLMLEPREMAAAMQR
ncbi:Cell division control protein 25 [Ceratocystis fimbriata CBS 114723]|uniref:Cell division control protein 25 n=1 Tax=Ceratocystis fimbriata CBS 114723 TaxID=1035309 RepID=A0A2C5X5Z0_9PEZI|nr:Cell division control protein 25 [Ceratocystis fimbriata CBS 114723]